MTLTIKTCTLTDLADLVAISRETFADTFAKDNSPEDLALFLNSAYTSEKLTQELENPHSFFYFLTAQNEIVGYLKLNTEDAQSETLAADALEVERIYIRKGYLRNGYGNYLLQFAEKFAKKHQKQAIWLGVWEHNEAAKGFYAKMGFKEVGQHEFYLGNDCQKDLLMLKNL